MAGGWRVPSLALGACRGPADALAGSRPHRRLDSQNHPALLCDPHGRHRDSAVVPKGRVWAHAGQPPHYQLAGLGGTPPAARCDPGWVLDGIDWKAVRRFVGGGGEGLEGRQ